MARLMFLPRGPLPPSVSAIEDAGQVPLSASPAPRECRVHAPVLPKNCRLIGALSGADDASSTGVVSLPSTGPLSRLQPICAQQSTKQPTQYAPAVFSTPKASSSPPSSPP